MSSTARSLACPSRESGWTPVSEDRASASGAGSRRVAPEVLVFAKVEFEPDTPWGSLFLFSENLPPSRIDSAARESDAMAPAFSWVSGALGSLTYVGCEFMIFGIEMGTEFYLLAV